MAKQTHHKYTTEQDEWIKAHASEMKCQQLTDLFNETFSAKVTSCGMVQKLNRMGCGQGTKNYNYTQEQRNFLREKYGTMPMKDLHKEFCEKFNCNINFYNLKGVAYRMGCVLADDEKHKFSMRIAELNRKPIGTEHKRSGYTIVKVSDEVGKHGEHTDRKNWKLKQRVMWEKYHGREVPPNCQICFLDGNRENYSKENLVCIPLRYMSTMAKNGWIKGNSEITQAGLKYCELYFAIQDKRDKK